MKKEDLKIVFLGTPDFAVESLDLLVKNEFNIVGVVTATDKPAGRGHKMLPSAVKQYAVEHGLHLMQPERLKDESFIEELRSLNADLFIVIAFRMLPEVVWQMPRLGTFNLHASLLPKYRGAAPINWAVINGEKETGVTTFFLKHEIDTGDVIQQQSITIDENENVGSVHDRLMHLGAQLTLDTVNAILDGNVTSIPQSQFEGIEPTPAPKIFRDTCHIDLTNKALDIHNQIRGLSPYPGAWIDIVLADDTVVTTKIFESKINDKATPNDLIGKVYSDNGHLYLGAVDKVVEVITLQPAGKRRMTADEFLRGTKL
ncbi:MAG: methionyl-tRNA formyltransferase [Muribaculaceae bacterium]|nr:methionyl-tRNA formyltransferase [Muribaculaceae bacterium]